MHFMGNASDTSALHWQCMRSKRFAWLRWHCTDMLGTDYPLPVKQAHEMPPRLKCPVCHLIVHSGFKVPTIRHSGHILAACLGDKQHQFLPYAFLDAATLNQPQT